MTEQFDDEVETVEVQGLEELTKEVEQAKADIQDRRTFIGGSDAPVIIGVSPWKSRAQLWMEKTGKVPAESLDEVERVISGKYMEDVIARIYTWKFGDRLRKINERVVMDGAAFPAVAQIDRKVEGARTIVEIKNVDISQRAKWGEPDSAECPDYYYTQIQHQLMCKGYSTAIAAPFFGGNTVERRFIARSPEFIDSLYTAENEFWLCVQSDIPPEPLTDAEAALVWSKPEEKKVSAEAIAAHLVGFIEALHNQVKTYERKEGLARLLLMRMMENLGDTLTVGGKPVCTWKPQTVRTFDLEGFKKAHPEMVAWYTKESTTRVFRLSKAGKETKPDMGMVEQALIEIEAAAFPAGTDAEEDEE